MKRGCNETAGAGLRKQSLILAETRETCTRALGSRLFWCKGIQYWHIVCCV